MKKMNNSLFTLSLFINLGFLTAINFFRDIPPFMNMDESIVPAVSGLIVILIVLLFIYREVENNKTQNEFITIVAHKFRTPLTGIRWSIEMLQKDMTLLEKEDMLLEMQKANERLIEIVNLLISFVGFDKKMEFAFDDVQLSELVKTSLIKYSTLAEKKNITINFNQDNKLPVVIADTIRIQFVIDMLIDNALKYTHQKGSVSIVFHNDKKSIIMKVIDTGIGISFFDKKKIFRNFFRAPNARLVDVEGMGLGLYTARKIVKQHKGKMWVESKGINKGSTFFVQLPLKR